MAMTTEEIIIFAALVAFSVLCFVAFLIWIISLICICAQKNVNGPKVADKERHVGVSTGSPLRESNKDSVDIDGRPRTFYEVYTTLMLWIKR